MYAMKLIILPSILCILCVAQTAYAVTVGEIRQAAAVLSFDLSAAPNVAVESFPDGLSQSGAAFLAGTEVGLQMDFTDSAGFDVSG